jgi:hypothetical protein
MAAEHLGLINTILIYMHTLNIDIPIIMTEIYLARTQIQTWRRNVSLKLPLLTQRSIRLEEPQLFKIFPAFYATRLIILVFKTI